MLWLQQQQQQGQNQHPEARQLNSCQQPLSLCRTLLIFSFIYFLFFNFTSLINAADLDALIVSSGCIINFDRHYGSTVTVHRNQVLTQIIYGALARPGGGRCKCILSPREDGQPEIIQDFSLSNSTSSILFLFLSCFSYIHFGIINDADETNS